jgi:PBP superfamily domain
MSSTDNGAGVARCNNRADCSKAAAGEALEWYSGAGEYCPECGEALTLETPRPAASSSARGNAAPAPPAPPAPAAAAGSGGQARSATATSVRAGKVAAPTSRPKSDAKAAAASPARGNGTAVAPPRPAAPAASAAVRPPPVSAPAAPAPAPPRPNGAAAPSSLRAARRPKFILPLRWFWVIAAALIASAAIVFAARPNVAMNRAPADADKVTVCPVSSATQLAVDLVHGYVEKSSIQANRFVLGDAKTCDVSFSMTPETPDDVIAHDAIVAIVNPLNPISRISESQLRAIFSGSIRDWSALGMRPGAIVPMLPDAETDEAKALATSLLFGVAVDQGVRRDRSSAAVARSISSSGRNAIGLVTFSQAASAKIVPLSYLPMPSVLSIASGRYPYTLALAVRAASGQDAVANGLVGYVRSSDGAAIVVKNGLVPRKGL